MNKSRFRRPVTVVTGILAVLASVQFGALGTVAPALAVSSGTVTASADPPNPTAASTYAYKFTTASSEGDIPALAPGTSIQVNLPVLTTPPDTASGSYEGAKTSGFDPRLYIVAYEWDQTTPAGSTQHIIDACQAAGVTASGNQLNITVGASLDQSGQNFVDSQFGAGNNKPCGPSPSSTPVSTPTPVVASVWIGFKATNPLVKRNLTGLKNPPFEGYYDTSVTTDNDLRPGHASMHIYVPFGGTAHILDCPGTPNATQPDMENPPQPDPANPGPGMDCRNASTPAYQVNYPGGPVVGCPTNNPNPYDASSNPPIGDCQPTNPEWDIAMSGADNKFDRGYTGAQNVFCITGGGLTKPEQPDRSTPVPAGATNPVSYQFLVGGVADPVAKAEYKPTGCAGLRLTLTNPVPAGTALEARILPAAGFQNRTFNPNQTSGGEPVFDAKGNNVGYTLTFAINSNANTRGWSGSYQVHQTHTVPNQGQNVEPTSGTAGQGAGYFLAFHMGEGGDMVNNGPPGVGSYDYIAIKFDSPSSFPGANDAQANNLQNYNIYDATQGWVGHPTQVNIGSDPNSGAAAPNTIFLSVPPPSRQTTSEDYCGSGGTGPGTCGGDQMYVQIKSVVGIKNPNTTTFPDCGGTCATYHPAVYTSGGSAAPWQLEPTPMPLDLQVSKGTSVIPDVVKLGKQCANSAAFPGCNDAADPAVEMSTKFILSAAGAMTSNGGELDVTFPRDFTVPNNNASTDNSNYLINGKPGNTVLNPTPAPAGVTPGVQVISNPDKTTTLKFTLGPAGANVAGLGASQAVTIDMGTNPAATTATGVPITGPFIGLPNKASPFNAVTDGSNGLPFGYQPDRTISVNTSVDTAITAELPFWIAAATPDHVQFICPPVQSNSNCSNTVLDTAATYLSRALVLDRFGNIEPSYPDYNYDFSNPSAGGGASCPNGDTCTLEKGRTIPVDSWSASKTSANPPTPATMDCDGSGGTKSNTDTTGVASCNLLLPQKPGDPSDSKPGDQYKVTAAPQGQDVTKKGVTSPALTVVAGGPVSFTLTANPTNLKSGNAFTVSASNITDSKGFPADAGSVTFSGVSPETHTPLTFNPNPAPASNGTATAVVSGAQTQELGTYAFQGTSGSATRHCPGQTGEPACAPPTVTEARYSALTPARILDTRPDFNSGVSQSCSPGCTTLGPQSSLDLQVTGKGGVPAGATAAILNITVDRPTTYSFLSVYPAGTTTPTVSNLNYGPGQTVPNLVQVPLSSDGKATIYNDQGFADVIADVQGYVGNTTTDAGLFNPLPPKRVLDTRATSPVGVCGTACHILGPNQAEDVKITGQGGVPASGVSAVVLNMTVTDTSDASFLTVYPKGAAAPNASNLNWGPRQTIANRVIVPVGTNGMITIYNSSGTVDVLADVNGWYTGTYSGTGALPTGSVFYGVTPTRITDTRPNTPQSPNPYPNSGSTLGPQSVLNVAVAGVPPIPGLNASPSPTALVANVTAVSNGNSAPTFFTVYPGPANSARPTASDLNPGPTGVVPNLTVVRLGSDGTINVYNDQGSIDALVDVFGFYACSSRCPAS